MTFKGLFVAFEGGEGSGKSTQAHILAERIGAMETREPGGTEFGERVRHLFQHDLSLDIAPRAEALLVAASRSQHVQERIRPALLDGKHVVSDRFVGSSLAYQAYGRGLDPAEILELNLWATENLLPDVSVYLDVSFEVLVEREHKLDSGDRFELEDPAFHERVRVGYRELCAADPDHWLLIDGSGSIEDVADAVYKEIQVWCETNGKSINIS